MHLRDGGPELVAAGSGLRTEFVTCCDRPRAVVAEVEGTGDGDGAQPPVLAFVSDPATAVPAIADTTRSRIGIG
jgi:hypothetical protein